MALMINKGKCLLVAFLSLWYNIQRCRTHSGNRKGVCLRVRNYIFSCFRTGKCSWLLYLQMVRRRWQRQLAWMDAQPSKKRRPLMSWRLMRGHFCVNMSYSSLFLAAITIAHNRSQNKYMLKNKILFITPYAMVWKWVLFFWENKIVTKM